MATVAMLGLVILGLYFAQEVLIPLALSILFCFLLTPVVVQLERLHLRRVPSVVLVTLTSFGLIVGLGWVVGQQLVELASNVDQYKDNIIAKFESVRPNKQGLIGKITDAAKEIQDKVAEPSTAPATGPTDVAVEVVQARTGVAPAISQRDIGTVPNPATQPTRENPLPVAVVEPKPSPLTTLGRYLGLALGPLGTAGLVIVFAFFMLLQREDLRDRLIRLIGYGQLQVTTQALDDASERISRYLTAQAIVNATYGITIAIGLWIIGATFGGGAPHFPNVVLWGMLCAVLRFIPYIGPWIAAAFPLAVSLAVYKGFGVFVSTGLMFVVVELLSNNVMEPLLYGSSTGMSSIAILVSAVFWTWLWGPVGLLLATPLTVCLVVVGKYVPGLQFLDIMLGDEPVLAPHERVYQRMLAMDQEEAEEIATELLEDSTLEAVYDEVLIPALALAEQDRHRGRLDDERQRFIHNAMRELIDELAEDYDRKVEQRRHLGVGGGDDGPTSLPAVADAIATTTAAATVVTRRDSSADDGPGAPGFSLPKGCIVNVTCLPAQDEADEIVALMLSRLLERGGFCPSVASVTKLVGEMVEMISATRADIAFVSALPPSAVTHARYLCKRVHRQYPNIDLLVGLWGYRGDVERARQKITCATSVEVVSSLRDALRQLVQHAQPLIVSFEAGRSSAAHGASTSQPRDHRGDVGEASKTLDPEDTLQHATDASTPHIDER